MHLIATIPGGWNPNDEGVFYIDQKPGDVLFLSAAETELYSCQQAWGELLEEGGDDIPSLRLTNLGYLKQELTIDCYLDDVVGQAKLVIMRVLGGVSYYPYLIEQVAGLCEAKGISLLLMSGHDSPDVELLKYGNVDLTIHDKLWHYLIEGGLENTKEFWKGVLHYFFKREWVYTAPKTSAGYFLYEPFFKKRIDSLEAIKDECSLKPLVVIIAYRAHYLSNNLEPLERLTKDLSEEGFDVVYLFAQSLRDTEMVRAMFCLLEGYEKGRLRCCINTTSFAMSGRDGFLPEFLERRKLPVIQAIMATTTKEVWKEGTFGLPPTDIAMNVALPEMDGRIITKAISFKEALPKNENTDAEITIYKSDAEGCQFVASLAKGYARLQEVPNEEKKVALVMPNYPNKDSRLGNGVGLDTPESVVSLLHKMKDHGFSVGEQLPANSDDLMGRLTQFITNELETLEYRKTGQCLDHSVFVRFWETLSSELQEKVQVQWGDFESDPYWDNGKWRIPGYVEGNIFISIQPSRGYHMDVKESYHSPDLPPPYSYYAFYIWLRMHFGVDAIIHTGKHGNLEWLPGKSISLSEESCFPACLLGSVPNIYPFIVNDPGEGSQAKRRTHAVVIDHLIPAMTRAESYGDLQELEGLIDEYYQAFTQDPKRTQVLLKKIKELLDSSYLKEELGVAGADDEVLLQELDGYLCEIKEAQIRDGLHILGRVPEGQSLVDLLVALHRIPSGESIGVTQALAQDLMLDWDPVTAEATDAWEKEVEGVLCRTKGAVVSYLEERVSGLLIEVLEVNGVEFLKERYPVFSKIAETLLESTLPLVAQTSNELDAVIEALEGKHIAAGPSGAPTRGRLDILPTGRNFYSVDVRSIPTEAAYEIGSKSADSLITCYLQEHGEYPQSIGLSVWGTSTMRTGGDDIAQAMALMGVRPVWEKYSRRLVDFEVISLSQLGRPRIDVILRISGFFRDSFPDIISLYNALVEKVAEEEEPLEQNPIRKRYLEEQSLWLEKGCDEETAKERSLFRVFGSKPGAYGAGLQALIDESAWDSSEDLAKAYMEWSHYAYGAKAKSHAVMGVYETRLKSMDVVLQNQDNREHDILDSDDYYQFQGGMANAVRTVKGETPEIYFGDHSKPEKPKVKTLDAELKKVYRSRVVNPKWIESVKKHGYKGAFEMAATLDYLFAFDATTDLVGDYMYEGVTESYLKNDETRKFLEEKNPWAMRDMTTRLMEAIHRGMWENVDKETMDFLRDTMLQAEGCLEDGM